MIGLVYGSLSKEEAIRTYWERSARRSAGPSVIDDQVAPPKLYQRDGEKSVAESEEPETELSRVDAAAGNTKTDPSDAQREAGNYRKGRFWWNALEIVIETPKGEKRHPEKHPDWPDMPAHYGYIRRTLSEADGDHVDVFVGPNIDSQLVYVIDQVKPDGKFDEHKVVIGCNSEAESRELYRSAYQPNWKVGPITAMTVAQFKAWLSEGNTGKPLKPQVSKYSRIAGAIRSARAIKYRRIAERIRYWKEADHPRDSDGKFTDGGGVDRDSIPVDPMQPWNSTQKAYVEQKWKPFKGPGVSVRDAKAMAAKEHANLTEHAWKQGKKLPDWQLDYYPGLRAKPNQSSGKLKDGKRPRSEMPQIAGMHKQEFLDWLKDSHGITSRASSPKVSSLKPTQTDYNPAKVDAMLEAMRRDGVQPGSAVIASNDDHILDGHHRWITQKEFDGDSKFPIIRVDVPIDRLLQLAEQFPKSFKADVSEAAGPRDYGNEKLERPSKNSSVDDWQKWMDNRIKEVGNRDEFLASDEYKAAYPDFAAAHKSQKSSKASETKRDASKAMKEAGVSFGDRVTWSAVSPFGFADVITGVLTEGSDGRPKVKLDEPFNGKKTAGWHKGWKPVKTKYHRIAAVIRYALGVAPFREEQHPRDADGKFAIAGRIKAAVEKQKQQTAPPASESPAKPKGPATDFTAIHQQYPPANPSGLDTQSKYRDRQTGQYTPERTQLHQQIIGRVLDGVSPSNRPTVYMLGGGTAAGKSSAVKSGLVKLPDNAAHIDPDGIKGELPEYQAQVKTNDVTAAGYNHEESSDVSNMAIGAALKRKADVVMDTTGDSGIDKLREKVQRWRAAGHRVSADYCTVPTDMAIERSNARAAKTGRFVAEDTIRGIHAGVSQVVPQAIAEGLYDDFRLWDTSGGTPRLLAVAAGTNLKVHDAQGWQAFLDKGKQTEKYRRIAANVVRYLKEWNESDHPRDESGRFSQTDDKHVTAGKSAALAKKAFAEYHGFITKAQRQQILRDHGFDPALHSQPFVEEWKRLQDAHDTERQQKFLEDEKKRLAPYMDEARKAAPDWCDEWDEADDEQQEELVLKVATQLADDAEEQAESERHEKEVENRDMVDYHAKIDAKDHVETAFLEFCKEHNLQCEHTSGSGGYSRYFDVAGPVDSDEEDNWIKVRISDHYAPNGAGFNQSTGTYHDEPDVNFVVTPNKQLQAIIDNVDSDSDWDDVIHSKPYRDAVALTPLPSMSEILNALRGEAVQYARWSHGAIRYSARREAPNVVRFMRYAAAQRSTANRIRRAVAKMRASRIC